MHIYTHVALRPYRSARRCNAMMHTDTDTDADTDTGTGARARDRVKTHTHTHTNVYIDTHQWCSGMEERGGETQCRCQPQSHESQSIIS